MGCRRGKKIKSGGQGEGGLSGWFGWVKRGEQPTEQKSNQQGEGVTLSLGRGLVVGGVNKKFQRGEAAVWGPLGFFVFLLIFQN